MKQIDRLKLITATLCGVNMKLVARSPDVFVTSITKKVDFVNRKSIADYAEDVVGSNIGSINQVRVANSLVTQPFDLPENRLEIFNRIEKTDRLSVQLEVPRITLHRSHRNRLLYIFPLFTRFIHNARIH